MPEEDIELTILMPCLNEAETLETCIKKAQSYIDSSGIKAEILIADNGSTDGSQEIARSEGARVVDVEARGYGAALIEGTKAARGTYVIMGDADDSYDFEHLDAFVKRLREGSDLVMGNRFDAEGGGIEPGAMPPLHRYLGNPVLSFAGRLIYGSKIRDFHCGLRGYNRQSILDLGLQTTGMEYASEMVVKSELNGLKISEVPTTLKKDGRSRPPHLRSWHDGWRHLKFLLMHSPKWLFIYPGIIMLVLGLFGMAPLTIADVEIGDVTFGVHTLLFFAALTVIGINVLSYGYLTQLYAKVSGFIPSNRQLRKGHRLESLLLLGGLLTLAGIIVSIVAFSIWGNSDFGDMNPNQLMRITIPGVSLIIIGIQLMFLSFFAGILEIKHR